MVTGDVLGRVRDAVPDLSAAENRVAQFIIREPQHVVELTITDLATATGVSQATIARFAQGLGYTGYREFRLALAGATSREEAARARFALSESEIDDADPAREVATKIAYQESMAIEQTARELDLDAVDRVAAAVVAADRIEVFGVGASALTAQDLQQKLVRIGLRASFSLDGHLALTSAALMGERSVAIAVSHTGETDETIRPFEIAAAAGSALVAVTNVPTSSLARVADEVLLTRARESPYRTGAMSSRIAQLTLVDILFVRVAQRMPAEMSVALERTYDATRSRRRRPTAG
ncbi:MurR/RpiR family transcriptional regulator [Microbacterium gorillae]|uniref:MurR/RpiR family transcriptional regulator n=1 Tax=Microbacterium gorillae TaxID=1231063 RepID=UPI000590E032|nr:MurR/RpiR family transcriptional regulator [Microbacterium gorillae]